MSVAACGGSGGGDDKKSREDKFNRLLAQLVMCYEEHDDEDVDKMNISSAEETDRAATSKKRGSSPYPIGKSKSQKKVQTDVASNKSKKLAKKERRKQIAKERPRSPSSGAYGFLPDQLMAEIGNGNGNGTNVNGKEDLGEMADDSRSEGEEDGSESDGMA